MSRVELRCFNCSRISVILINCTVKFDYFRCSKCGYEDNGHNLTTTMKEEK